MIFWKIPLTVDIVFLLLGLLLNLLSTPIHLLSIIWHCTSSRVVQSTQREIFIFQKIYIQIHNTTHTHTHNTPPMHLLSIIWKIYTHTTERERDSYSRKFTHTKQHICLLSIIQKIYTQKHIAAYTHMHAHTQHTQKHTHTVPDIFVFVSLS